MEKNSIKNSSFCYKDFNYWTNYCP